MTPSPGPGVVTIDVAHPPMGADRAEAALEECLRRSRTGSDRAVMKVIHGYGSSGRGGTLKETVRNWAYRKRDKLALVVPGEVFSLFSADVQEAIREAGNPPPSEFADINRGMTVIFLK